MGEPTYHPDFFEILEHAQMEKVAVGLTTNGSTLGGKRGKGLLEYNLHQLDISLQTPNKKSFELTPLRFVPRWALATLRFARGV